MAFTPNTIFSALSTVNDLLSNFTGVDAIGIFDSNTLEQIFADARPLKAEMKETAQVMNHPTETGTILSDNRIINPIEINFSMIIKVNNFNDVYNQIKQAFVASTSLIVQTHTGVYPNMIIADMPHSEQPDMYDAIAMTLHLKEILYVSPNVVSQPANPANFSPANPVNSNVVQAGQKYSGLLSSVNTAAVTSIFAAIGYKMLR